MKKGRLYNRQEIELISKSAIGKSVNDILNEEIVTIEDKDANKGDVYKRQIILFKLFSIISKFLKTIFRTCLSKLNNAYNSLKVVPLMKLRSLGLFKNK